MNPQNISINTQKTSLNQQILLRSLWPYVLRLRCSKLTYEQTGRQLLNLSFRYLDIFCPRELCESQHKAGRGGSNYTQLHRESFHHYSPSHKSPTQHTNIDSTKTIKTGILKTLFRCWSGVFHLPNPSEAIAKKRTMYKKFSPTKISFFEIE